MQLFIMKKIFFYSSILLLLNACVRESPITDEDYRNKIVVNSLFSSEDEISIKVSKSIGLADSLSDFEVANPRVSLTLANGDEISFAFDPISNAFVSNGANLAAGDVLQLMVFADNLATVTARTTVPVLPKNLRVNLFENVDSDTLGVTLDRINVKFDKRPTQDNFYEIKLYAMSSRSNQFEQFIPQGAEEENPGVVLTRDGSFLLSDKDKGNNEFELNFTIPFDQSTGNPRYMIEAWALSREFFEYQRTLALAQEVGSVGGGLIGQVPVQVYSNIQNGRGIFAAKSVIRDTIQ